MVKTLEIKLAPADADKPELIEHALSEQLPGGVNLKDWRVVRRSIDARQKKIVFVLRVEVNTEQTFDPEPVLLDQLNDVHHKPEVLIVGAGPAGYFAALELIELGFRPLVFDRGKDVQARRRDLRAIQQFGIVNRHSNYCFGEGGAGTYSDGKLYTRSHKRGSIFKALKLLVEHGASSDILVDAHPHIGSNKLPKIVAAIRATIEHFGGKVHFNAEVTDLELVEGKVRNIVVNGSEVFPAKAVILATGHSARGIYRLLHQKKIKIEAKPFALGVRVEHRQSLIDKVQYRQSPREASLPAASYKLACQVGNRGVFSFCMCPGGLVVPASTAPGEIVVNGMSLSKRDSPYANSGTVVSVELEDLKAFQEFGVFAGLEFQRRVERKMFESGDGSQNAPALRLPDFIDGKLSKDLPPTSYIPGLHPAPLYDLLPPGIYEKLVSGMKTFSKKMKGYYTREANVIGTESRTSSPVRIPRDKNTLMHSDAEGLFPCGEGAGYAGGIISAAMDGQNVAKAVNRFLKK